MAFLHGTKEELLGIIFRHYKYRKIMKTKKITLIYYLFLGMTLAVNAQSRTVASGGNGTGSGGSFSYTAGLIDYTHMAGTGGVLTAGIQQPLEIFIVTGISEKGIHLNAIVYPNPADDFVQLSVENATNEQLVYELMDLGGKSMTKNTMVGNESKINLASYPEGVYYLRVFRNNQILKSFKIIKSH
jgi:hypothetical protein